MRYPRYIADLITDFKDRERRLFAIRELFFKILALVVFLFSLAAVAIFEKYYLLWSFTNQRDGIHPIVNLSITLVLALALSLGIMTCINWCYEKWFKAILIRKWPKWPSY